MTVQDICTPGYSKKVLAVTAKLKRQAYAQYGIMSWEPGDYEVDHLIPLSLGGSNSIKNLWPNQNPDGSWSETLITGTGFPLVFYLKYDMYGNSWPLMALARYQTRLAEAASRPVEREEISDAPSSGRDFIHADEVKTPRMLR